MNKLKDRRFRHAMVALICLAATSPLAAAQATVILSQGCEYLLLDSSQGQILMKIIKGEVPKAGDTLKGTFRQRDFAELTVQRNEGKLNAWIDLIDRSGSKALMRYSQYCEG